MFNKRLKASVDEYVSDIDTRRNRINTHLAAIDNEIALLRNMGFDVTVNWPYGRGPGSQASSTSVKVIAKVEL